MPQPPQFAGSDEVSTQSVPQAVCVPGQLLPPVPPLPVPVAGPDAPPLLQATAKNARPSAKIEARVVVMAPLFPGGPKLIVGPARPPDSTEQAC
jgi:hypothetical protein